MRFKGTVLMTAAFIGIVLYYFLLEIPGERKRKEEKELSEKVLAFKAEDVDEFSLVRHDQTIVVRRTEKDGWEIVQPVQAKADGAAAESVLERLQSATFSRVVEENPADLAAFGLKQPSLQISLKWKSGGASIAVGDGSPIGHSLYVKRGDQDRVLLSPIEKRELDRSLFELRDKTTLSFPVTEVVLAEIQRAGGEVLRFDKKNAVWTVTGKSTTKGDAGEIENLLNSVRSARVSEFVDEDPKDLSAYGLAAPSIRFTVTAGEKNPSQSLLIGSQKEGGNYYAKVSAAKNVFAAGHGLVETLSRNELDFPDKSLLDFKEKDVAEIELVENGKTVHLVRDKKNAKGWRIDKPIETEADPATASSLLFDLKDARISAFLEGDAKNLKAYGLDAPQKRLSLWSAENKSAGFKLGNKTNDGKSYFAAREGEPSVFVLPDETVNKIFRALYDLRNRKLLRFKSEDAEKISIHYPDRTFELKRRGEDWELSKPETTAVKPFVPKDILWTLSGLEFESIVDPPLSPKETGLDRPAAQITVSGKQDKPLGKLTVGAQTEEQTLRYAQVEGTPALYRIKERFMKEMPRDLEKFKK
ncbi:MAG: DUF4340 domain-containing protein [Nitrospinae bacterium]|nr:DUF4340 domain-containing protein [Nitrospinota bacterium]